MTPCVTRRMHVGLSRLELRIDGRHARGAVVPVHANWTHVDDELDPDALAVLDKARHKAARMFATECSFVLGELLTDDTTTTAAEPQEGPQ